MPKKSKPSSSNLVVEKPTFVVVKWKDRSPDGSLQIGKVIDDDVLLPPKTSLSDLLAGVSEVAVRYDGNLFNATFLSLHDNEGDADAAISELLSKLNGESSLKVKKKVSLK